MTARIRQILFTIAVLLLCWLGMLAVHELGHVIGALATGGTVVRVDLHPLAISQTHVSPNPHPAVVVWLGPVVGSLLPLVTAAWVGGRSVMANALSRLFAGFCLVGNGAYIFFGAFAGVGDCREMLDTGTPVWVMLAFGALSISMGLGGWHSLGPVKKFLADPSLVTTRMACIACGSLVAVVVLETLLSP